MVTAHGVTHPGHVRPANEESWFGDASLGFFVVADGMGGHNAGEVASRLAVDAIHGFLKLTSAGESVTWPYGLDPKLSFNGNRLLTALKLANRRVFKVSESRDAYTGMGTTIVAALFDRDRMIYSSVGDSRVYSFADNRLQQLTRDDSWIVELLDREPTLVKADLADHPMRHVLTNVIGARETIDIVVIERRLLHDELVLLCSDGLYGEIGDAAIAAILAARAPVAEMAEQLMQAALAGPAGDNITAVLVKSGTEP